MTRINVVPVTELSDAMLGAEYRELPRVVGLVRDAQRRGEYPEQYWQRKYTLGTGHVCFFYPRLLWVIRRYDQIVKECRKRGRQVSYPFLNCDGIAPEWFGQWKATQEALKINRARLRDRGNYGKCPDCKHTSGASSKMVAHDEWICECSCHRPMKETR